MRRVNGACWAVLGLMLPLTVTAAGLADLIGSRKQAQPQGPTALDLYWAASADPWLHTSINRVRARSCSMTMNSKENNDYDPYEVAGRLARNGGLRMFDVEQGLNESQVNSAIAKVC